MLMNLPFQDSKPVVMMALNRNGRALMTRDAELIRRILAEIQHRKTTDYEPLVIPDADVAIVARHLEMLHDAGYIEAVKSTPISGDVKFMIKDLTWEGHDLAAVLENNDVWSKIKSKLSPSELATIPLTVLKSVGLGLLEHYMKSKFGL
jgi:hypothetical protein